MNREIKFRGKRVDNGEWAYGYYLKSASAFIAVDDGLVNGHFDLYEVNPETIGQFTGLYDKNGKEIYEGDILSIKFNGRYIERVLWDGSPDAIGCVFWDFNSFRLKCKNEVDCRYADFYDFIDNYKMQDELFLDMNLEHTEIIGNIHDNPELLTE